MSITVNNKSREWATRDSIHDMTNAILKNFPRKEVNLVNIIKSCLRNDKLTLQGIEEERNKAGMDITKKFDLGLLHIFIHQHGIELARLKRSKHWDPNLFEDVVVTTRKANCLPINGQSKATQAAVADAVRLFAKSDIQFIKDYHPDDLRFNWQAGQIW